jgi:hypothetical protein
VRRSSAKPRWGASAEGLVAFFAESGLSIARLGLEAGALSQWLYAGGGGCRVRGRLRKVPADWTGWLEEVEYGGREAVVADDS